MSIRITLAGCSPEPMAAYLKALAVFRLVAEQADGEALAWWDGNAFCLESTLDRSALIDFFLEKYSPTPIVAPWNRGSGFYEGDRREGINALLASGDVRFRDYRETIQAIQAWPELPETHLSLGEMLRRVKEVAETKRGDEKTRLLEVVAQTESQLAAVSSLASGINFLQLPLVHIESSKADISGETAQAISNLLRPARKLRTAVKNLTRASGKEEIVQACRNRLSDRAVDWIDAAVVMRPGSKPAYPPILGTGGNEGRLDYTNAFMERLAFVLLDGDRADSKSLLLNALFGEATSGLVICSVGQHDPGRAGGYNQGFGVETKDFPTNPWNFVLAMEGAVAWASGVARRQGIAVPKEACSPFTVRSRAVGYYSASDKDESLARAEIWMPLWDRPARFEELRALLREGRAEIGRRYATDGLQFAEAAVSLGVDRGITAFMRYQLLKRRGDSYVALPAARFLVSERREVDLLEELNPILTQIDGFRRNATKAGQSAPARFLSLRRAIDQAIYEFLVKGGATHFKEILVALGRLEQYLASQVHDRDSGLARPLWSLSPAWIVAADDGSLELRIAAALASIQSTGKVGPLRANLTSIDPEQPWVWSANRGQHAWTGNSFARRLANVLQRRMMDAQRLNCDSSPLRASLALHPGDVSVFLSGRFDESATEALLFALTLVNWQDRERMKTVREVLLDRWREPVEVVPIPRSWALLKHLFLPFPVRTPSGEEVSAKPEPAILPLLCAQRLSEACEIAQRRLFAAGLRPTKSAFPDAEDGIRLAAGLLVPIHHVYEISGLVLDFENSGS